MNSCLLLVICFTIAVSLADAHLHNRFNARKEKSERLLAGTTNLASKRLGLSQSQLGLNSGLGGISPLSTMSSMGGRLGKKASAMNPYATGLGGYNGLAGYGAMYPLAGLGNLGNLGNLGALNSLGGLGMMGGMSPLNGLMAQELKPKGAVYNLRNYEEEAEKQEQARGKRQGKKRQRQRQRMQAPPVEEDVAEELGEEASEVPEDAPKPVRGKKQLNRTRQLSKKAPRGKGVHQAIDAITLNQDQLDEFMETKKTAKGSDNGQIKKLAARWPAMRQGRLE